MPRFCAERSRAPSTSHAKPVRGSRIAILGVSYKAGVGDLRESPGAEDHGLLASRAPSSSTTTTSCRSSPIRPVAAARRRARRCDVAVIVTAHPGLDLDTVLDRAPLVVDFRGVTARR